MPDRIQSRGTRLQHRRSRRRPGGAPRPATTVPRDQNAQIVIAPKVTQPPPPKETIPDYSYVYKDLKNIGLIVGGIIIVFMVIYFTWK